MSIDINRRLLIRYSFINVLNTITKLNEQLSICLMNEVRKKILLEKKIIKCYLDLAFVNNYLYGHTSSFSMDLCI